MVEEKLRLPDHFIVEEALLEQLGARPGHQRCVVGQEELLLIVHEVPLAGIPERSALFFWKGRDQEWQSATGPGLDELSKLFLRYTTIIDEHEQMLELTDSSEKVFGILRHAGPLARSLRNLVGALESLLIEEPDDRAIRNFRDRARELERAAELLLMDARETLAFWQAQAAEGHMRSADRLERILFRLNLVTGFFLPLVALGGIFGMNVEIPSWSFFIILVAGLLIGGLLLWFVSHSLRKLIKIG